MSPWRRSETKRRAAGFVSVVNGSLCQDPGDHQTNADQNTLSRRGRNGMLGDPTNHATTKYDCWLSLCSSEESCTISEGCTVFNERMKRERRGGERTTFTLSMFERVRR